MGCCICCNSYIRMFEMFHLYHTYVASIFICVLHIRACKRIFQVVLGILEVLHMDVAYVCNNFHVFF
jgi:hypothetical protein